jgi:PPK2 family polyphosphate:nucleotide phosphotransferase
MELRMTGSRYLVPAGKKLKLADWSPDDTGDFKDKEEAVAESAKNLETLADLQNVLYAEAKRSVLVVLQAIDAGGKDGTIRHVFSGIDPQGCDVTSFKVPSALEKSHDFLWRIHARVPQKGMIGIFNRSHYESVLVERVKKITPKEVWSKRYDHINAFEKMLADEGVTILKFFLHISKKEQKHRMMARLDQQSKNWKFNPDDLADRALWEPYMEAYEDMMRLCSTSYAPWYIVPADRKWFRNWLVGDVMVQTLKAMDPQYPPPAEGLEKIVID